MKNFALYLICLLVLPTSLLAQYTGGSGRGDFMMLFPPPPLAIEVTATSGVAGPTAYATLKATFDKINDGTHQGVITIKINGNTNELASAVLNASGTGSASYTAVTAYPTTSGLSISGSLAAPLIDLNGADHVTIDGRVNQTGSKDLTIQNTSNNGNTGTSTIRFINDACANTVMYCTIKGSSNDSSAGILFFSTTTGSTGNDGNTIDHNDITSASGNRPLFAIYANGTPSKSNSENAISNNNIYDFINTQNSSAGIAVMTNNTVWTISNNSIYETTNFNPSSPSTYTAILVDCAASGANFTVSNNFIGGNSASCGGTWQKNSNNNTFYAIKMNVGTGTASNIQGNTIRNISFSNNNGDAPWYGIWIGAGDVNIGTTTANIISSININNNSGSGGANFYGVYNTSGGTVAVSNNTIGHASNSNSINAGSNAGGSQQSVYGVFSEGSGNVTVSGNLIANILNGNNNSGAGQLGLINGIYAGNGTNTISNNTIRDLMINNSKSSSENNPSLIGINLNATSPGQTISGNTINNLFNPSMPSALIGIRYNGGPSGPNRVSGNFIYNFGAGNTDGNWFGIRIESGVTTYANNIISLGRDIAEVIYGVYVNAATPTDNINLYYNTVFIGGNVGSGNHKSFALYCHSNNGTRDFRNNILTNVRSTSGGTGLHFASYFEVSGGSLTCNYNDYYVSGTGSILGYFGNVKSVLPIVTGVIGNDAKSKAVNPMFASPGGNVAANYLPAEPSLIAKTGTGVTTDYIAATRNSSYPAMGAYEYTVIPPPVVVSATLGVTDDTDYTTLKAAFDAINVGTHQGDITIKINTSTTESASAVLNASGSGGAGYTSVNVYPTATGLSISGNLNAPLIDLNGADHVTINGSLNGLNAGKDLIIVNSNTASDAGNSTIRFINDASDNTVSYCKIKGSSLSSSSGGVLYFSTGATSGNDTNIIEHNDITSATDANRPVNAICSVGSSGSGIENSGDIIRNNNIYDVFSRNTTARGIYIGTYSTTWTISENNFYETSALSLTSADTWSFIYIQNSDGNGFTITDNFMGGSAADHSGVLTMSNALLGSFNGIYLNVGSSVASSIQNNTMTKIAFTTTHTRPWYGIYIDGVGNVNIGTVTGNVVGATTGNGSVVLTNSASDASSYGIYTKSTGVVVVQNNKIGAITTVGSSTVAHSFGGVFKSTSVGTTTISDNVIGSTDAGTTNSIYASSTATSGDQSVFGICSLGTGTITISGNTISKMTDATTNSSVSSLGQITGIYAGGGANSITNNSVSGLTIANANNVSNNQASVSGIVLNYTTAATQTITGNTIYNLSNSADPFGGFVIGLYYNGSATVGTVSGNFIHHLSAVSQTGMLYGIDIAGGSATYSNNIIGLGAGITTGIGICGVKLGVFAGATIKLYYNTIDIEGTVTGTTSNTFALSNIGFLTRDYRNNIFNNSRSGGLTGKHFAVSISNTDHLTIDYNDYFAPNGVLGTLSGEKTSLAAWRTATSQDVHSINTNPGFASAGGATAANYLPSTNYLVGVTGTGILADYAATTRSVTYPAMGAYDYAVAPMVIWVGSTSSDWNDPLNWSPQSVPTALNNITIPVVTSPNVAPIVTQDPGSPAICNNLTIESGAVVTIAPGKVLNLSGSLTNNSVGGIVIQSDATGTGSMIMGAVAGSGTVAAQRYMTGGKWNMVSSPLTGGSPGQSIIAFLAANLNVTADGNTRGMMDHNTTTNLWNPYFTNSTSGYLTVGKGFAVHIATGTVTFTGVPRAGTQSIAGLAADQWNCIGNPYTSAIGINTGSGSTDNFLNVNAVANLDPNFGAIYVWDKTDTYNGQPNSYKVVSNVSPDNTPFNVQQGQGFFVKTKVGVTAISFTPDMQFHSPTLALKSAGKPWPMINLLASVSGQSSSTLIAFNGAMTKGLDPSYDAGLLRGGADLVVYSKLVEDNGIPFAIQALPDNDFANMAISLGLEFKTGGEVVFSAENMNLPADCKVVLEDKLTNTFTDLSKGVYKIAIAANSVITDRFRLLTAIQPSGAKIEVEGLTAYAIRNIELRVVGAVSKDAVATLYDVHGKFVLRKKLLEGSTNIILLPNVQTGIYMLSIQDNGKQKGFKILVSE